MEAAVLFIIAAVVIIKLMWPEDTHV